MERMTNLAHNFKEPAGEELIHQTAGVANDNEEVLSPRAPSIEAANDNEALYSAVPATPEAANDNEIVLTPSDEERLQGILGRLGIEPLTHPEELTRPEGDDVPAVESPESVETAPSPEREEEAQKIVLVAVAAAAAGGERRKDGGGGVEISGGGSEGKKRKPSKWLSRLFKLAALPFLAIGAIFALSQAALLKLQDKALDWTGSKGGGGGAKKASDGHGGGGHGGGH